MRPLAWLWRPQGDSNPCFRLYLKSLICFIYSFRHVRGDSSIQASRDSEATPRALLGCTARARPLSRLPPHRHRARLVDRAGARPRHGPAALPCVESQSPGLRRRDQAAREWFTQLDAGITHKERFTIEDACKEYLEELRRQGRTNSATDSGWRFKRTGISCEAFGRTEVVKLRAPALKRWRDALLERHSDGRQMGRSGVNRMVATLRAALPDGVTKIYLARCSRPATNLIWHDGLNIENGEAGNWLERAEIEYHRRTHPHQDADILVARIEE